MSTFVAPPWPPTMDADAIRFGEQLVALYAADHGSHAGGAVDALGWLRWGSDYRIHRANGLSHDAAWFAIEHTILAIWGADSAAPSVPTPAPITGAPTRRPLIGPLRVVDKIFHDDTGPRRVLFCSWFPALRILRDSPREFYRQLDAIAAAGYQGFRTFLAVGGWSEFWDGREVAPVTFQKWFFTANHLRTDRLGATIAAWPDYDELLRVLLRACRSRQLRLHVTCGDMQILCPDGPREVELHRRLSRICAEEGGAEVVALYEVTNEFPINRFGGASAESIEQMGRVIAAVKANLPQVLTAQGANPANEEPAVLQAASRYGDVCAVHPTRDPFEKALKRTLGLVYWEGNYRAFWKAYWNGEPAGPGRESHAPVNDPASLVALYAMHALTGMASVRFQGAAVRAFEPLESEWGFVELPQILEAQLPEDVATWDHASNRRGGIEYWWRDTRFATATWRAWDTSPPRPIVEWTLYSGDNVVHGTGTPPPATGLIVGTFR